MMNSNHVILPFCVVWDECGSTRICMDHVLLGLVGLLSNLGTIPLPACMLKLAKIYRRYCSFFYLFPCQQKQISWTHKFRWSSLLLPSLNPGACRRPMHRQCVNRQYTCVFYMSHWRLTCISEHLDTFSLQSVSSYTNSLDLFAVRFPIFFIDCPFSPIFMPTLGTKNPNDALDQAALAVLWRCLWASSFDNPYEKLPLRIRVIHNS